MLIIDRIVETLKEKGLTQADICKYLNIKSNVFTTWKTRKTDPPTKYLVQICDFLNISLEYLLTGEEKTSKVTTIESPIKQLTENEKDILEMLDQLSERDQIRLLGRVEEIVKEYVAKYNVEENVG